MFLNENVRYNPVIPSVFAWTNQMIECVATSSEPNNLFIRFGNSRDLQNSFLSIRLRVLFIKFDF